MRIKTKYIYIIIFLVVILLFNMPRILWEVSKSKDLNVFIVDKTVPDETYREHKSLVWILNNQKYVKSEGKSSYEYKNDYYGFFPKANKEYEISDKLDIPTNTNLIYIADTYGVYTEEYYGDSKKGNKSERIYGGITLDEVNIIKKAVYNGSDLVAEFNTFGSPTDNDTKETLYDLLGLNWTGWKGRYFEKLDKGIEVPNWAVSSYESKEGEKWNFTGYGFVFVDENEEVIVLTKEEIEETGIKFSFTEEGGKEFGENKAYKYMYWFDIIEPINNSQVLAKYDLKLSKSGQSKLVEENIPLSFPAVVKNKLNTSDIYYFAGDYVDYTQIPKSYKKAFYKNFMKFFAIDDESNFYWKAYIPMMEKILENCSKDKNQGTSDIFEEDIKMISRTNEKLLQIYKDGSWEDMFVKGVNMGMAIPGKWFTEFPNKENIYYKWFEMIGDMNANNIRVYTLMHPTFYSALKRYNEANPEKKLWLLQEIWPEEHPEDNNYLKEEYINNFNKEIEYTIDAIHGDLILPERKGRAYGDYYVDVSEHILGFLVGREFEPEEVVATNKLNNITSYKGDYLEVKKGSPTEVWLAESCDYLMKYQVEKYNWQHPVSIVSWPTLDVMEHDAEWNEEGKKSLEYNDKVSIDIRNILLTEKNKAGFFGSYHIYPNYPDFMNNTKEYSSYKDDEGVFHYGGYLREFIENHQGYPALVAEFGLATGSGNAHTNPDGYNHGAMTEQQQGEGIVRMMKTIKNEEYAGGIIFEWINEWAKKTWTTEPFIVPYEHNVFWHNNIDPEQNYGILAMESIEPKEYEYTISGENEIKNINLASNETYLYIDILLEEGFDFNKNRILIGLDTYDDLKGSFSYDKNIDAKSKTGMEFMIEVKSDSANILVIPSYNIGEYKFASVKNVEDDFVKINPIINAKRITKSGEVIPEIRKDGSKLNYGKFEGSFTHWYKEDNTIRFRIPWGRINVTDPTTHMVLDDERLFEDYPERDYFKITKTEGINTSVVLVDNKNKVIDKLPVEKMNTERFLWETWGEPNYQQRLKDSYSIIQKYFAN